jgi:hypothetical protein
MCSGTGRLHVLREAAAAARRLRAKYVQQTVVSAVPRQHVQASVVTIRSSAFFRWLPASASFQEGHFRHYAISWPPEPTAASPPPLFSPLAPQRKALFISPTASLLIYYFRFDAISPCCRVFA